MWSFNKKGSARINSVVGSFQNMIDELDKGIVENFKQKDRNLERISQLNYDNTSIDVANNKASTLITKLHTLLED